MISIFTFTSPTLSFTGRLFRRFQMTIADRRRLLERDLWKLRPWVIEDPSDPDEVLYLSESEFHKYQQICLSNNIPLTIIARGSTDPTLIGKAEPDTTPNDDSDHQSPTGSASTQRITIDPSKLKASPKQILKLVGELHPCEVNQDSLASLTTSNSTQLFRKYIQKVSFWTYGRHSVDRLKQGLDFADSVTKILEKQTPLGLVLRLKVSLVALNAYVGGCPLRHTRDLGYAVSLTRDGLPRWIPSSVRSQIKIKDKNTIRMWASILNTYKGIKGNWKVPDTKTVNKPRSTVDYTALTTFSRAFWASQSWVPKNLIYKPKDFISTIPEENRYHISGKAGPNGTPSFSPNLILYDLVAWLRHPKELIYIRELSQTLGLTYLLTDIELILTYMRSCLPIDLSHFKPYFIHLYMDPENKMNFTFDKRRKPNFIYKLGEDKSPIRKLSILDQCLMLSTTKSFRSTVEPSIQNDLRLALLPHRGPILGKLTVIKEAAGKSRIIAINDFFTQQVLKPLHLWLFEICRYLPQDSTFDQEGSLSKFVQRTDMTEYFSYDLSSATDLIPVQIYQSILSPLIGTFLTDNWISLLIDKDFKLSGINNHPGDKNPKGWTRYTRGQPMGALSSWGLMNLGHHIINQYAHFVAIIRDLQIKKHHSFYFNYIKDIDIYRIVLTSDDLIPIEKLELILPGFIHYMVKCLFNDKILPFDKYVVLGDDNVIGHRPTAESYFELMTTLYDVPIKLAKSYVSTKLINFANQTYFDKVNISPIPFKEYLSLDGISSRIEFASRTVRRFFSKPSIFGLLRYITNSQTWEMLSLNKVLGKVYEPILPLLFVVTMIKLPSFIPDWEKKIEENPIQQYSVTGALLRLTHSLYINVVSNQSLEAWYRSVGKKDIDPEHPHLRAYIIYLIKCLLHPHVGNRNNSITLAQLDGSIDRLFPSKIAFLGLVRHRRQEMLWMIKSRNIILRKSAILKEIFHKLRRPLSLSAFELTQILITLIREPNLPEVINVLTFMSKAHLTFDYSAYESSPSYYMWLRSILESDSSDDKLEQAKIHQDNMTNLLIRSTFQYLDLGGSLNFDPISESTDTTVPAKEMKLDSPSDRPSDGGGTTPCQEIAVARHPGPQA